MAQILTVRILGYGLGVTDRKRAGVAGYPPGIEDTIVSEHSRNQPTRVTAEAGALRDERNHFRLERVKPSAAVEPRWLTPILARCMTTIVGKDTRP
jgi:hypothetical protein